MHTHTHVHVRGAQDCIIIMAFILFQLWSMQTGLHVCVCVCIFARYTRDRVQSRDIEWKEKDGGELMRKRRRIQSIAIDNPNAPLQERTVPYTGSIFEKPFENYGSVLGLRNDFSGVIFGWVSGSRGVSLIIMRLLALKKKKCLKMGIIPVQSQYRGKTAVEKHHVGCILKLGMCTLSISYNGSMYNYIQ